MKEFDPRTSDMSSDRTKNADGTHEVSRTANGMRAVSGGPNKPQSWLLSKNASVTQRNRSLNWSG